MLSNTLEIESRTKSKFSYISTNTPRVLHVETSLNTRGVFVGITQCHCTQILENNPLDLKGHSANFKDIICSNITYDLVKLSHGFFLICS